MIDSQSDWNACILMDWSFHFEFEQKKIVLIAVYTTINNLIHCDCEIHSIIVSKSLVSNDIHRK